MNTRITQFLRDEEGATAIEYGIIAGLMAVILVTVFNTDVREMLRDLFDRVRTAVDDIKFEGD